MNMARSCVRFRPLSLGKLTIFIRPRTAVRIHAPQSVFPNRSRRITGFSMRVGASRQVSETFAVLEERVVWTAVSAARSLSGDRHRTLDGLVAYLRAFLEQPVAPVSVQAHLDTLIDKGTVLKVGDCYLPLKRWR